MFKFRNQLYNYKMKVTQLNSTLFRITPGGFVYYKLYTYSSTK